MLNILKQFENNSGKLESIWIIANVIRNQIKGIATLFWCLILNSTIITHSWHAQMHYRLQSTSRDPPTSLCSHLTSRI